MMKRFTWGLRRELWENRWLYLAPMAVAVVVLIGFTVYAVTLPKRMATQPVTWLEEPYQVVQGLMMLLGMLLSLFYCIDALYGERRDRSVLLWKSLPVSDTETVLVKICIPTLVLPVILWALAMVLESLMLGETMIVFAAHGLSVAALWSAVSLQAWPVLYHLVAFHGISVAPIYAWALMVSAWAPRAPLAWAVLPPLGVAVLERLALGTTHFTNMLGSLFGGTGLGGSMPTGTPAREMLMSVPPGAFVTSATLWVGLLVASGFLFAATRIRRARV